MYGFTTVCEIIRDLPLFKTWVCETQICRVTQVSQTRVLWKIATIFLCNLISIKNSTTNLKAICSRYLSFWNSSYKVNSSFKKMYKQCILLNILLNSSIWPFWASLFSYYFFFSLQIGQALKLRVAGPMEGLGWWVWLHRGLWCWAWFPASMS